MSAAARLRATVALVLLAGLAAALLAGLHQLTAGRIAANEAEQTRRQLAAVLPAGSYDNAPELDVRLVTAPDALGSADPLPVYRARRAGEPVAAALTVVAPDGYVDAIRLLVGIRADGTVTGVRAVAHNETPGLGDGIDTARSDWILGFAGRTVQDGQPAWALKRDGGDLDQLTGATITSRAVVKAVYRAVNYFLAHRDELFAPTEDDAATP